MKKIIGIVLLAAAVTLLFSSVAFANFGPHGGYANDTDACAGCHRAHTSISSVTWTDHDTNTHSALLVSSATEMSQFCYACHGEGAPGASTNVFSGIFDSGPSGQTNDIIGSTPRGVGVMYQTNSSYDATLNGGGFSQMPNGSGGFAPTTSMHNMDVGSVPLWGAGNIQATLPNLTCTDCHDPHGSSNYRLLKDQVNSVPVGGYDANDNPTPFVWSAEANYPTPGVGSPNGGWLKHQAGATQMASYRPDYTSPEYKWVDVIDANNGGPLKNMSMWCSACHKDYGDPRVSGAGNLPGSLANYGSYESAKSNSAILVGTRARHRHPVNITLAAGVGGVGVRALAVEVQTSTVLPLERNSAETRADAWSTDDYIGCLTCHRAHGAETTMTGWASSSLDTTTNPSAVVTWFPVLDPSRNGGVNPSSGTSSLLRAKNRGVCELCHNK